MFDRVQSYWVLRFAGGFSLLLASGCGLPRELLNATTGSAYGGFSLANLACGAFGFWVATRAVAPMVRSLAEDRHLRHDWGSAVHDAFANATTARQVFCLLLAVAEADGPASATERDLVRRFLLQRFTDGATATDLRNWEAQTVSTHNLARLARRIARGLGPGDLATLYTWSCQVALDDGNLTAAEHDALRQVARGFGLIDEHARLLFTLAQQAQQRSRARPSSRAEQSRQSHQSQRTPPPAPAAPPTARQRALTTLGLPPTATPAMIRKRHRELVRRFHPDAHASLGPVAQQEAGDRFREIQRAYETLLV